jgi:hypothetical protein
MFIPHEMLDAFSAAAAEQETVRAEIVIDEVMHI